MRQRGQYGSDHWAGELIVRFAMKPTVAVGSLHEIPLVQSGVSNNAKPPEWFWCE